MLGVFVSASHQTGLDTRSMTRKSVIVRVEEGGGRARAETRTLLDYAGHHHPAEGLESVLDFEHSAEPKC